MSDTIIDYSILVDEAMHTIVKKSLQLIADENYMGDNHFFISFITTYPEVQISNQLKEKYPQEMTIVIQYQFEDLIVSDEYFEVTLSFNSIRERLVIPYKAMTSFADPSVKFGLQFRHYLYEEGGDQDIDEEFEDDLYDELSSNLAKNDEDEKSNVVTLDSFRKKH
jgi:hypothetical protein